MSPEAPQMNGTPPASRKLDAREKEPALLHRSLAERPLLVSRALGSYLYLDDGRKILDACGGAAVAIIGHGNKDVIAAVAAQMQQVSYVHTMAYTTTSAEELATLLLDPRNCRYDHGLRKVYLVGSGSEANDAAMKCARQYWYEQGQARRRFFVSRRQAYHGSTIGSMSISSNIARKQPYEDVILPSVSFVSPAYSYRYKHQSESEEEYAGRLVRELEDEFLRLGPENIISFTAETVVGATSGCLAAPKGYFKGVREVCDQHGILLHLDEVMCGMGRTGTYFAFEQEGIKPDILTLGKGLGGGYAPIAAMLVGEKVVDVLRTSTTSAFNHGHTYQAHPVTCAAALAVQRFVREQDLVARCQSRGRKLGSLLRQTFTECKYVGNIRGKGLFWALEFVSDRSSKEPFATCLGFGVGVQKAAFEMGLAVYPGIGTADGSRGDHVLLAPPYTMTDEELEVLVHTLRAAYDREEARVFGAE